MTVKPGGHVRVGNTLHKLVLGQDTSEYRIHVPAHGNYALFTQHGLGEFDGALLKDGRKIEPGHAHDHGGHAHDHEHDATVSSVGIEEKRELEQKLQRNPAVTRRDVRFLERFDGGLVEYGVHPSHPRRPDRGVGKIRGHEIAAKPREVGEIGRSEIIKTHDLVAEAL